VDGYFLSNFAWLKVVLGLMRVDNLLNLLLDMGKSASSMRRALLGVLGVGVLFFRSMLLSTSTNAGLSAG
jgi:hypothetical protein